MTNDAILLEAVNLKKYFLAGRTLFSRKESVVKAVDNISLQVFRGESLGLVGESGCGKSTLGRVILRLLDPTSGSILYNEQNLASLKQEEMRQMRRRLQIIFQDPYASLNPRMTVRELIAAPLDAFGIGSRKEKDEKILEIMKRVGLREDQLYRYPHEFSGGQRQRIVIARALILNPEFVVCDEPVSALDVSVRSQVINLMRDLQKDLKLTYLFISHDLSVVKHISDRVAVMYLGKIVELADTESLFDSPRHPYTKALLDAIPLPDANASIKPVVMKGEVPSALNPPAGCRFHTRCTYCTERCRKEEPELREYSPGHFAACHLCTSNTIKESL